MLRIIINNKQADLEGVKFTLQLNSPIPFVPEDGLVEGSFAFGVIFPATKINKEIFGFPHRLEMYPPASRDFAGSMYFNGRMLFGIIVTLTQASDYNYRANIKVDLGYYSSLIGDKLLRDLVYEGDITLGTTTQDVIDHATAVVAQAFPAVKYNFPQIYHPNFYGDEKENNLTWQDRVNFYIHGTGFQDNVIDSYNTVQNYYNLCPLPYLFYVLEHCFTEFGYKISGPVLVDTVLAKLLIYNNYALDLIEDRYKLKLALSALAFIDEESIVPFDERVIDIDICYDLEDYKYLVLQPGNHHITTLLSLEGIPPVPGHKVEWFADVYLEDDIIASESGLMTLDFTIDAEFNFIHNLGPSDVGKHIYIKVKFMDFDDTVICSGNILAESWMCVQNVPWSQLNTYAKSINLANHVPDIKISTFLVTLQKAFGIVYSFDPSGNAVELLFLKDILADVSEDVYTGLSVKSSKLAGFLETRSYKLNFAWSSADELTKENFKAYDAGKLIGSYATFTALPSLAIEGSFAIVLNLNAVYQFVTDAWVYFTDRYYAYQIGDGKTAITIDCSPMMMYDNRDNPAVPKVYPQILQEGSSAMLGMQDFGFHLLFYHGLQQDSEGNSYPFASSNRYGPTGIVIGNYDFTLDGAYGLFINLLEDYYNFVINRSRPVEFDRFFTASEIRNINFIRKKRIFQNVFFLDEVIIPMSKEAISTAGMKLIKA